MESDKAVQKHGAVLLITESEMDAKNIFPSQPQTAQSKGPTPHTQQQIYIYNK